MSSISRAIFYQEIKSLKRKKKNGVAVDNSRSGVNWLHWERLHFQDGEVLAETLRRKKIKINLSHCLCTNSYYTSFKPSNRPAILQNKNSMALSALKEEMKLNKRKTSTLINKTSLFIAKVHIHCPVRHLICLDMLKKKKIIYQAGLGGCVSNRTSLKRSTLSACQEPTQSNWPSGRVLH